MSSTSRSALVGHGRALAEITAISGLGILATAGFQVVAARGLGADDFGLLAAFLAIVNVVAVGSSALRNSVAVATAAAPSGRAEPERARRWDGPSIEAWALGGVATVILIAVGPVLVRSLEAPWILVLATAVSILPYFFFARAQGILQGVGATRSVVWWTTGSQLLQLALTIVAVALGAGALGVLLAVLTTAAAGMLGASIQVRRTGIRGRANAFTAQSVIVLLLTVVFSWMTNADVVLVRTGASAQDSGAYAAGAVLVKTMLVVPSILSLYLLPRFARARDDRVRMRQGLNLTLAFTATMGLLIFAGLWVLGGPIVALLYGGDYTATADLIPWMALMSLPWSLAQAALISVTAGASRLGLGVAIVAAAAQSAGFLLVLPDVMSAILVNGLIGLATFISFYVVHLRRRPSSTAASTTP